MKATGTRALRAQKIIEILAKEYGAPKPGLEYANAWQLLVAAVLSAQCTDKRVNAVVPGLFAEYPTPEALAGASVDRVEKIIRSIGLFRAKARNLVGLAEIVAGRHEGAVPSDRAELERLPGVGRKTASVVLAQAFGVPAFPVDTHVYRVCRRLGLSAGKTPLEVEKDATRLLAPADWLKAHLLIIHHGRQVCAARNPKCGKCPLINLCPWPEEE